MLRLLFLLLMLSVAACGATPRLLPPPPKALYLTAEPPVAQEIRNWGDEPVDNPEEVLSAMLRQLSKAAETEGRRLNGGKADILILSGGGSDGAYGAGLLTGWTQLGTRPEFLVVTGVSTGALMAPFAFLGSDYDKQLEALYTRTSRKSVFELAIFDVLTGGLAVGDTSPAKKILNRLVTPELVRKIAAEHRRGRRLWIGTTNLDAQRPVVWNIGAVAASGRPDAPALIRQIMLASSAIPGVFPPVLIEVEANGRRYSEMHVDGGVTHQLFFYPYGTDFPKTTRAERRLLERGTIYVIRNTQLAPRYEPVESRALPIVGRAVSTMIKTSGLNDVRLLAEQAKEDRLAMQIASLPEDFSLEESEPFDPVYMRALFDLGKRQALGGTAWRAAIE